MSVPEIEVIYESLRSISQSIEDLKKNIQELNNKFEQFINLMSEFKSIIESLRSLLTFLESFRSSIQLTTRLDTLILSHRQQLNDLLLHTKDLIQLLSTASIEFKDIKTLIIQFDQNIKDLTLNLSNKVQDLTTLIQEHSSTIMSELIKIRDSLESIKLNLMNVRI